ncbi:MAG: hypothetical protein ABIL07_01345 [candidate division WOR-3 bacterium]
MGNLITIHSSVEQFCRLYGYSVDGRRFDIYSGILFGGDNKISIPASLGPGVYFICIQTPKSHKVHKFVYLKR